MTLAEQFIQEGLEEGFEKGIEKGIEKGAEAGHRADILEVLRLRFGDVPGELSEAVEAVAGTERLRALHRAAVLSKTVKDFQTLL